ncbi:Hypothetical protein FKW44_021946, partial [Caligus rogercresseyi]
MSYWKTNKRGEKIIGLLPPILGRLPFKKERPQMRLHEALKYGCTRAEIIWDVRHPKALTEE